MPQNIYDRPDFFGAYSRLPRSVEGLAGAPEWPALQALLPDLGRLRIVDLGCGFGWFCRYAQEHGAAHVRGIDVSENMLARARRTTSDPSVVYQRADLETLELPEAAFDLAFSSLAFHYVENLEGLLATLYRALRPGARLVTSMEHPIYTAPAQPAWSVDAKGRQTWPIDHYFTEGARTTDWLAKGVVKQHRTMGTVLRMLLGQGFGIAHVEEWCPTDAQVVANPELAEERHRPMFLLLAATR
jgi:ubiquinone/menaquinone biosynthesis C-methylase UbiE